MRSIEELGLGSQTKVLLCCKHLSTKKISYKTSRMSNASYYSIAMLSLSKVEQYVTTLTMPSEPSIFPIVKVLIISQRSDFWQLEKVNLDGTIVLLLPKLGKLL